MSHLDVSLNDSAVVYIFNCTKFALQYMFTVLENSSRQELFLVLLYIHKSFRPDKFRLLTGHLVNFSQSKIFPAEQRLFGFVSPDDTYQLGRYLKQSFLTVLNFKKLGLFLHLLATSLLQRILLTQGSNLGLLHGKQIPYHVSYCVALFNPPEFPSSNLCL